MRTSRVSELAFVDVVAKGRLPRVFPETGVAIALEAAGSVEASVGAVVRQFQALVHVDASSVVLVRQSVAERAVAVDRVSGKDANV